MKYIDRNSIAYPAFYKSSQYQKLEKSLHQQAKSSAVSKGQSRMKIQYARFDSSLVKPLFELFNSKCAYCEEELDVQGNQWTIDRFRPISLYPWLAYTWENLYLSCNECSRAKGQEFLLVQPEKRATNDSELTREVPQIIDPCSKTDKPEEWLRYLRNARSRIIEIEPVRDGNLLKAEGAIKSLNLNRVSLSESRWSHWSKLNETLKVVFKRSKIEKGNFDLLSDTESKHFLSATAAFAGMTRQLFCELFLGKVGILKGTSIPSEFIQFLEPESGIKFSKSQKSKSLVHHVTEAIPKDKQQAKHVTIKSVSIKNFKAISSLSFDPVEVPEEDILEEEEQATMERLMGWTTLIGENGSGKSSILQAITLALAGESIKDNRRLKPSRFLTRGKRLCRILLTLSSGEIISLKITKKNFIFEKGGALKGIFIRAYGSTRLLPHDSAEDTSFHDSKGPSSLSKYKNMFDPFVPLLDAGGWLDSLKESDFTPARLAIKDLLGLRDNQDVKKYKGEIEVDGQPLENLSSGYQTLVALACDIMAGVPEGINDMRYAPGIVLLDEIGAHLHPAWKMRIVARLRKAFPLMQFFISTHEPLCLRGHSKGEVLVVKRDFDGDREVRIEDDLPSPKGLRVDQLLTSEHFGLESTIDPAIDESFSEYYQLLSNKNIGEGSSLAARRDKLGHELQGYGILGYTRRDQLVYKLIDEYLAEDSEGNEAISQAGSPERWEEVKKRVADLWQFSEAFERKNDK